MLTHRRMIKAGIGGAALLFGARMAHGLSRGGSGHVENGYEFRFLSKADAAVVAAVAPAMLDGAMPRAGTAENVEALRIIVQGTDGAVSGLTPSVQSEVRELFDLLNFPFTRILAAGLWKPWSEADLPSIGKFLGSWQKSRFQTLRSGYDALHELITAAWYANPKSWGSINYPGPPEIRDLK